jgi:hypothetical protein
MEHTMTKPIHSELKNVLPELFSNTPKPPATGGMCNPETGCAPENADPQTDIAALLKKVADQKHKD